METKTTLQTTPRPDLIAAIKDRLNPPVGYIGNEIYPMTRTADKSGTIYFQQLVTDVAAQTNRTTGTAPTTSLIASANTTFSASEIIKRFGIPEDEAKELGGIESADKVGALGAVRSVFRSFESSCAAKLIDGAGTALVEGSVLPGITRAALAVRRYPGKLFLVCSQDWFLDFIQQTDVKERALAMFPNAAAGDLPSLFSLKPSAMTQFMATLMQFDGIKLGDNDHWKITGKEDVAAIVKLLPGVNPTEDEVRAAYKLDPMYGVAKWFLPDPANMETMFDLSSWYNPDPLLNTYTAQAWVDIKELNSGAKTLIKLPAQSWATTTSHA